MRDEINKDFVGHYNYKNEQAAIEADNVASSRMIPISSATKQKLRDYWTNQGKDHFQ